MGRLIGARSDYAFISLEVRFHAARKGLAELVMGQSDLDDFLEKCRGFWFKRGMKGNRGLQRIVSEDDLDAALDRFEDAYYEDRVVASRRLAHDLLDPVVEAQGKRAWVEVSGPNIRSGPGLLRIFPEARFVHMMRDGRAVAASIVHKESMTNDPMKALRKHWHERVRDSDLAARKMPEESILLMRLERLTAEDREESYRRLVDFLGSDDPGMKAYFDDEISATASHHGQWRERLDDEDAERVDRTYAKLLRQLHRDGATSVPSLDEIGGGSTGITRSAALGRILRAPLRTRR